MSTKKPNLRRIPEGGLESGPISPLLVPSFPSHQNDQRLSLGKDISLSLSLSLSLSFIYLLQVPTQFLLLQTFPEPCPKHPLKKEVALVFWALWDMYCVPAMCQDLCHMLDMYNLSYFFSNTVG